MGKTLIAEAGIFETMPCKFLGRGKKAYYTTPLIALTEQKYRTEISGSSQAALERWGYSKHYVGLVTGNRRENPDAPILVVVAEILFNRLLTHVRMERSEMMKNLRVVLQAKKSVLELTVDDR